MTCSDKMGKLTITTMLLLFFLQALQLNGQQMPLSSLYRLDPVVLSPAFCATRNGKALLFSHRNDWSAVRGSPETNQLVGYMPFLEKNYAGFHIATDRSGNHRMFFGSLSYVYKLEFLEGHTLNMGLWSNFFHRVFEAGNIVTSQPDDPLLAGGNRISGFSINAGTGFLYQGFGIKVGVSFPTLFEPRRQAQQVNAANMQLIRRQQIFYIAKPLSVNPEISIEPAVIVRRTAQSPTSVELVVQANLLEQYFASTHFRSGSIWGFAVGATLNNYMQFFYQFETGFEQILPGGNHEIGLKFFAGRIAQNGATIPGRGTVKDPPSILDNMPK